MKIVFFGTGAVAAELTSYLEDSDWIKKSGYEIKGYTTSDEQGIDNWNKYRFSKPYLGIFDNYQIEKNDYFILALSNGLLKKDIIKSIRMRGGKFANLIHPTAMIAPTAKLGEGNIIYPFAIIGPNAVIGDFNLLTSQTIISHDTIVGNRNFFATSLFCGHDLIGDDNYFGVRVTAIPNVVIGDRNKIQAGMIIDKNIGNDAVLFYRYKEKMLAIPKHNE